MIIILGSIFFLTSTIFIDVSASGKRENLETNFVERDEKDENDDLMPRFAEPIPNVTATIGRDATLVCIVDNLKGFKVAWVRVDTQTILSIHLNVITQNPRVSLSHNDHRSWYLQIKRVQESDRGWYMCQVNTDPMRSKKGYLQVVVPPSIQDRDTSTDMVVREGSNVTLTCKAGGYPEPYVMWRREDGVNINFNGQNVNVVDGEMLYVSKVSRLHMGIYLCIASNGVEPSISKQVSLRVQFPPELTIPNQLEAAYIGQDVSLVCHTEAYPSSINYWTTEKGDMILSGEKYEACIKHGDDKDYKRHMFLKIKNVNRTDFGSYQCVAKNSLGETGGQIKLEGCLDQGFIECSGGLLGYREIPAPSTTSTSTWLPEDTNLIKKKHRDEYSTGSLGGTSSGTSGAGKVGITITYHSLYGIILRISWSVAMFIAFLNIGR